MRSKRVLLSDVKRIDDAMPTAEQKNGGGIFVQRWESPN